MAPGRRGVADRRAGLSITARLTRWRGLAALLTAAAVALCLAGFAAGAAASEGGDLAATTAAAIAVDLASLPDFSPDAPAVELDGNVPGFTVDELAGAAPFELYGDLDALGRATGAYACVGFETMPTEERTQISEVKPSGWHFDKYDFVDGRYLFNRCHLIAFSLTGENANEQNLVTGTRFMNTQGMGPYETAVLDYVRATGNHVLFRVTPVYEGDNLVCSGVQMEAFSVEDGGAGVGFNVFVYNCQPGVAIDYATGSNCRDPETAPQATGGDAAGNAAASPEAGIAAAGSGDLEFADDVTYVLNLNTHKFHYPGCDSVGDMKPSNRLPFTGTRDEAIAAGYVPCKRCNP